MGSRQLGGWGFSFEVIANLQVIRKNILGLYHARLLISQWFLIYMLGLLLIISLNFIPVYTFLFGILKITFALAVLLVILLLHQLDNLTLFSKEFGSKTAKDVIRIIDEKDVKEITQMKMKKR